MSHSSLVNFSIGILGSQQNILEWQSWQDHAFIIESVSLHQTGRGTASPEHYSCSRHSVSTLALLTPQLLICQQGVLSVVVCVLCHSVSGCHLLATVAPATHFSPPQLTAKTSMLAQCPPRHPAQGTIGSKPEPSFKRSFCSLSESAHAGSAQTVSWNCM